ncbi:MAG: pilus assembly protein [Planctomycetaceae bacterium]|nr:pilus assembly protein [Planctomycetales bacterium]MCB9924630.1 pilus assembly protein [Planctomycetaceae bacterium]
MRHVRGRVSRRRGAATVELSICLPLFITILFGSIEASNLIYLRESLCLASYEAARQAVSLDASKKDIEKRAKQLLSSRGIDNPTITFSPDDTTNASGGEPVTVTVSVPASSQTLLPKVIYGQRTITAQTSFVKE